jgi:CheY-like chemotaxis protein
MHAHMINQILIVDDRYENRYLLQALLEGHGYQIISAVNGLDALQNLKTDAVDAIISDILMPEMDGFKLCRSVKENHEFTHIPFIFYTASYTESKDRDFGLSLGADEYIIKPVEPDIFITIINEVFSRFEIDDRAAEIRNTGNQTSFYSSYAEIIEKKLNKKLTELENQRAALQLSERKYQHFFKIIPEIGYLVKVGEDFPISFEGGIEEITGYPAEKFRSGSMKWEEIIHPDDKDSYLLEKEKVGLLSGNIFAMQYRIVNKRREIRWIHEIASVIPGTPQGVTMIQGAISDNTLQIESE